MRFRVGPWIYRVRITDGPLHNEHGEECRGLCVYASREILISGLLPPRQRIDTLMHELRHAWRHHFGAPADEESDCNNAASFAVEMMRQLQKQGGEPALMRLTARGIGEEGAAAPDYAGRHTPAQCARCCTQFNPVAIVTGPAKFDDERGAFFVTRSLYCDYCSHVQVWQEVATQSGQPTGQVAAEPNFLKGEEAAEFLRKHGGRFGVLS